MENLGLNEVRPHFVVCSQHFARKWFSDHFQTRKRLLPNAVPELSIKKEKGEYVSNNSEPSNNGTHLGQELDAHSSHHAETDSDNGTDHTYSTPVAERCENNHFPL